MSLNFDNEELTTECPNCKKPVTFTIKQIGSSITCRNCKSLIQLKDDGVKKGLADLDKTIKNLFK